MDIMLAIKPEHAEAIRRRGPGKLIGPIQRLPRHLKKVMGKVLKDRNIVQINEATDVKEARWLTRCPNCEKGYLLIWLGSGSKIELQCLVPDLAWFPE
jgi:hypothetical protein